MIMMKICMAKKMEIIRKKRRKKEHKEKLIKVKSRKVL
jgi:hypothetical protein